MKIITKNHIKNIVDNERLNINEIFRALNILKVDEGLKIDKEDWAKYYSTGTRPSSLIRTHFKKYGISKIFTTHKMLDKSGWTVLRIK